MACRPLLTKPLIVSALALCALAGCTSTAYRERADKVADALIQQKQQEALGRTEAFSIERPSDTLRRRLLLEQDLPHSGAASLGTDLLDPPKHWPEKDYPARTTLATPEAAPAEQPTLHLALVDALQVAARNNRDYQTQKENVFLSALDLDLARDEFRNTYAGLLQGLFSEDRGGDSTVKGLDGSASASVTRKLKTGATLTSRITLDLVKLLTQDKSSSLGLLADATISIPLLRDAGKDIVTEPLTQAERNLVYAIHTLERYKQTLAVRVARDYLSVLEQLDRVQNAEDNYHSLEASAKRARRLADAGRLPETQVDQAHQDELRARDRWISARQSYEGLLDSFKTILGLPADARIELDRSELTQLSETYAKALAPVAESSQGSTTPTARGGRFELDPTEASRFALENRLDLRTSLGRVYDAQRDIVVAANGLLPDLTLTGSGQIGEGRSVGSATQPDAKLRFDKGYYTAGLSLDLPWERTSERNAYRESFIALEQAVRNVQSLEDDIKLSIRNEIRSLLQARESYVIQQQAVGLAKRRVESTALFLQAGRAEIRDVLEAQEALVSAQNALTSALVSYRIGELELQRDMGALVVNEEGLWREYNATKEN